MSWRPDNWNNPYKGEPEFVYPRCCVVLENEAYEKGADAILEGIWKLAKESPTGTFAFDSKMVYIYSSKEEVKEC